MTRARGLATVFASTFRLALAALVAMALVTVAMYALVVVKAESRRSRLNDGSTAVQTVHAAMVDQETALRAYFLTGNEVFLEPATKGQATIEVQSAVMDATLSNGHVGTLLVQMQVAQRLWLDAWAVPARERRTSTFDTDGNGSVTVDEANAFLLRGKRLFDTYRQTERALLDRVRAQRADTVRTERALLAAGLIAQLLICGATATLGLRRYRSMKEAVVEPVGRMLTAMQSAADGQLSAVVDLEVEGPLELKELGIGLIEMTTALAVERALSEQRAHETDAQARKLRQILDLAREIAGSLSLRYVLQSVGKSAVDVSSCKAAAVWLLDEEAGILELVHDTGRGDASRPALPCPLGEGTVGLAARFGRTVTSDGSDRDERRQSPSDDGFTIVAAIPLVVGARVVGVLALSQSDAQPLGPEVVEVLETMAAHAAAAIEAARLHGRTQELTQLDALTRLPNRRRLDSDLALEIERSRRYRRPLSFLMLDVDHFKRCNDQHGHQVGDEVLQQVAATLGSAVRASDTVYRYGGEEFCVLLRETGGEGAAELADRLRASVGGRLFATTGIRVTISVGVAVAPVDGLDGPELIRVADDRLFEAKRQGRNRVVNGPSEDAPVPALVVSQPE